MNLKEIRAKVNDSYHRKLTVIKRDGKVVVRRDIVSPRNCDLHVDLLNGHVRRTLNVKTTPNVFHGRKGLYSNYWVEAIIEESNETE